MIERDTYQHLQDVIRRQGRSFLQYSAESFPWNTPQEKELLGRLEQMVVEERDGAAALSRYLVKHRLTPPYLGPYPSYFTSYNYMSLDRLLPLLVVHQKRGIEDLQADLQALNHDIDTRSQVQNILTMKKRHLEELQALQATPNGKT
jgi:hypothetical protein